MRDGIILGGGHHLFLPIFYVGLYFNAGGHSLYCGGFINDKKIKPVIWSMKVYYEMCYMWK